MWESRGGYFPDNPIVSIRATAKRLHSEPHTSRDREYVRGNTQQYISNVNRGWVARQDLPLILHHLAPPWGRRYEFDSRGEGEGDNSCSPFLFLPQSKTRRAIKALQCLHELNKTHRVHAVVILRLRLGATNIYVLQLTIQVKVTINQLLQLNHIRISLKLDRSPLS